MKDGVWGGRWTEAMRIKHFHCHYPGLRGLLETPRKYFHGKDFQEVATCFGKAQELPSEPPSLCQERDWLMWKHSVSGHKSAAAAATLLTLSQTQWRMKSFVMVSPGFTLIPAPWGTISVSDQTTALGVAALPKVLRSASQSQVLEH